MTEGMRELPGAASDGRHDLKTMIDVIWSVQAKEHMCVLHTIFYAYIQSNFLNLNVFFQPLCVHRTYKEHVKIWNFLLF